ncbi:hypothetical protein F4604DRAFT_1681331 [Suillus subluteus]|nr:hypothetical protein F4604DRAFT_1681331 [Suillus subluteus]
MSVADPESHMTVKRSTKFGKCEIPVGSGYLYQTAKSESDMETHANDVVPGTPSATSELRLDTDMPQDEHKPKCCRLRRWISIQLEKRQKEEALALEWAQEQAEAEEEQHRQDSEIVEVTIGYLHDLIQNRWDTKKLLIEANRRAQLLEINMFLPVHPLAHKNIFAITHSPSRFKFHFLCRW